MWRIDAPCCGTEIPCDWMNVDGFADNPAHAYLKCPSCGDPIPGPALKKAMARGRFVATLKQSDRGAVGFHIPELVNPAVPLAETARKHASAMIAYKNTGQNRELIDFSADALATTYKDADATCDPEAARINCRLPGYDPERFLPAWVSLLTMAADVQIDRLEAEIVGWGAVEVADEAEASKFRLDRRAGWQTWNLSGRFYRLMRCGVLYQKLMGDPNLDAPWIALNQLRMTAWRIGGPVGVAIRPGLCLVDAGGQHTERVRAWSRSADASAAACKGASREGQPLHRLARTKEILAEYGKPLCFVGTDAAKDIVLASVRRSTMTGDHTWCWPEDEAAGYDWRYFAGLLASESRQIVESKATGRARSRYVKNPSVANEPLDLAVYNLSALSVIGLGRLLEKRVPNRRAECKYPI